MILSASWGLLIVSALLGDDTNFDFPIKVHVDLGVPWCVSSSIGVFGRAVGGLGR